MPLLHESNVRLKTDEGTIIVEGKTNVPFQILVTLILQRKVFGLFKQWGKEPMILSSELLTDLASAPQDSIENRSHLVLVTLGVGVIVGIFLLACAQVILNTFGLTLGRMELFLLMGTIAGLGILTSILGRLQKVRRGEKITEKMEKLAGFLSK